MTIGAGPRTERQYHEAAVYDARAGALCTSLTDADLLVDADRPPYPNREHVDFLDFVYETIGDLAGKRVLEVGCGSGNLTTFHALRGARAVGVDVSAGMLQLARRRAEANSVSDQVELFAQPIEDLDQPEGSFDVVLANQVLHHLDLPRAMPNISRLVGDGGTAIFVEPVLFVPEIVRRARYSRPVTRWFPSRADTPDERSISVADVDLITSAFRTSVVRPFQLTTRVQNFVHLSDGVFRRLERLDRLLHRTVPGSWRLARYVVFILQNQHSEEPRRQAP
ncbi:MAG: class I SAM-dependent methyltransferase [Acidimicrobiia bacterium]